MDENVNLYSLKHNGRLLLCACRTCNYRRVIDPKSLERYSNVGDMASVAYMVGRMRCSACGQKTITGYGCPKGFAPNTFLGAGVGQFVELEEAMAYAKAFAASRPDGARG